MYLFSDSEVYLKQTFKTYVFIVKLSSILEEDFLNIFTFKLKSIFEVYFLNWCISFQTEKQTWSKLSILMYLFSNSEVYLRLDSVNLCIYAQAEKYTWSRLS